MAKVEMPKDPKQGYGVQKKPGLDRKLKDVFITDSPGTVGEHILWDVMIPGLKGMVMSALHGMVDGIFGGRSNGWYGYGGGPTYSYNGSSYRNSRTDMFTNYSGYAKPPQDNGYYNDTRRRGSDDTEYMFYTYASAADKKNMICEVIERNGKATIADVKSICLGPQTRAEYMDDNWGWYDVMASNIRMIPRYFPDGRDGYCLELPRPVYFR